MKIQYVSDVHLEFDFEVSHFIRNGNEPDFTKADLPKTNSDVIILAGDIWYQEYSVKYAAFLAKTHQKPTIIVAGNHDFFASTRRDVNDVISAMRSEAEIHHEKDIEVYYLENNDVILNDVRFLGCTLWTDYNDADPVIMRHCRQHMSDFNSTHGSPTPAFFLQKHYASRIWLERELAKEFDGSTVVITHHLPSEQSLDKQKDGLEFAYYSNLDDMLFKCSPDIWIHGHAHSINDYRIGNTRVLSNTRGYNEPGQLIKNYDPGKVVAV